MKKLPHVAAWGALLCLTACAAQAQTGTYQVTNQTLSSGDPTFSVMDDVTFTNLALTETFADGNTALVNLFDLGSGVNDPTVPQTSLDTGVVELDSATFANPDPTHGAVKSATLTGTFDNGLGLDANNDVDLNIATAFNGPTTAVAVLPNFSTTLNVTPGVFSFVPINAVDAGSGAVYGAGTLAFAPEPSPLAALGLGAVALGGLLAQRRASQTAGSLTN